MRNNSDIIFIINNFNRNSFILKMPKDKFEFVIHTALKYV